MSLNESRVATIQIAPTRERLKTLIEFHVPGFEKHFRETDGKVFYFDHIDSRDWYRQLCKEVVRALDSKKYYPIYRMGDGEYSFALGSYIDFASVRLLTGKQTIRRVARILTLQRHSHRSGYKDVGFEFYSRRDMPRARSIFLNALHLVSEHGVLALGLDTSPFYIRYYPMILDWFDKNHIYLNRGNYHHVYSVYALLLGRESKVIFEGQDVLVISGLIENQACVTTTLLGKGAKSVAYLQVSANHSMFDVLDLTKINAHPGLVLVSAGVGTVNILAQLESLACPCVDIGFALRVLGNPELRWERPFCVPDEDFVWSRVRWLPPSRLHNKDNGRPADSS